MTAEPSTPLRRSPKERLPLLLSFCLPFLISGIALAVAGLYPFGNGQIMAHDGWHQYYPFFRAFREKLLTGGSLQYTWEVGAGTSYLSLFAYYLASPLNLLTVLVPAAYLRELFAFLTVLKLGLAGLFFGIYLKLVYRKNDLAIPFFSLLYAFCAWACGYYWNLMWLDAFALLPLLIAGTVCLLREGKFRLYICALALSLWCNYYVAFFSCIFVLLCFFGFCLCCPNGFKGFCRRFVRIGVCTLIGVGIAAVLLLPTMLAMQTTYSAEAKDVNLLALNMASGATGVISESRGLWEVLKTETLPGVLSALRLTLVQLLPPPSITKMSGQPNLFCGFSVLILAIYYFCCRKIKLREKLFNLFLLVFFLLSFIFRILDYAWHGFHFPNMLPYRFSFLFSFVLLGMAYRAYQQMRSFSRWYLGILLPIAALFIVNLVGMEDVGKLVWVLSSFVFVLMLIYFLLFSCKGRRRTVATLLLFAVFFCEAVLSFACGVSTVGVTTRTNYPKEAANVQALLEYVEVQDEQDGTLFSRTEVTNTQALNDGALNGYHGVSIFTSSANVNFNRFSRSLGLSSWPGSNRYAYYEGTPFANLMLGIRYLLDRDGQHQNRSYNTLLASAGEVKLLENSAYIGLGFMTESSLSDFVRKGGLSDPVKEQNELFSLATGMERELLTKIGGASPEGSEHCSLSADSSKGSFSFNASGAAEDEKISVVYTVPQNGLYCASTTISHSESVSVYRNGNFLFSRNIKARSLFSLGDLNEGDELKFTFTAKAGKKGQVTLDVAQMNCALFDAGFAKLSDEPWVLTEFSDTRLRGTVEAKQDGLFYTSAPYEPGWTAFVDGKQVALASGYDPSADDVALTDAVISFPLTAGTHEIELHYEAPGLKLGAIVSAVSLLLFVLLLLLRRGKNTLLPPPEDELCAVPDEAEEAEESVASEETATSSSELDDASSLYDADFFAEFADLPHFQDLVPSESEESPTTEGTPPREEQPMTEEQLYSDDTTE